MIKSVYPNLWLLSICVFVVHHRGVHCDAGGDSGAKIDGFEIGSPTENVTTQMSESNIIERPNSTWFEEIKGRRRIYLEDSLELGGNVRQDIYNFYNINSEPSRNQRPYYGRPPPDYNYFNYDNYPYYQRPPYGLPYQYPSNPPYSLPQPSNPQYPLPQPANPAVNPTTAAPIPQSPIVSPIGYMLVDSYRTPFGSFSKPLAYFTTGPRLTM